jgi:hypothetical protein
MTVTPIRFNSEMVGALLDGRKTTTRRVIKLPTKGEYIRKDMGGWEPTTNGGGGAFYIVKGEKIPAPETVGIWNKTTGTCLDVKYQVGDLLWVKEAWRTELSLDKKPPSYACPGGHGIAYKADSHDDNWGKLRPSMFMCQWMSRITLEVTAVKIERLQDMQRGDAMEEGCPFPNMAIGDNPLHWFQSLWESINGEGSWAANPWVVAPVFTVHRCNVSEMI